MKRARPMLFLLSAVAALLAVDCLQLTGGGTDTETGGVQIMGKMVDSLGQASTGVAVSLIPALYDPVSGQGSAEIFSDTTDGDGKYSFRVRAEGVYNMQAKSLISRTRSLMSGISVGKRDIALFDDTLHRTGAIRVVLDDTTEQGAGYAYIPGTTFFGTKQSGSVLIDSVPAGSVPALYYAGPAPGMVRVIRVGAFVAAGDTAVIADYNIWQHTRRLLLNTTASGADVTGNAYAFPVLVRLTGATFPFSQAARDGRDIRFAKADGTPLPYQIEQWDSAGASAAVWVRIDTVYGNNGTQSLFMVWGNGAAVNRSSGPAVFDTAASFSAVWHLSEQSGTTYSDATASRFDGIGSATGMTAPAPAAGMVGGGQGFNGSSSGIIIPNSATGKLDFAATGAFTLSAWAYLTRLDSVYHPIVTKGDNLYGLQVKDTNDWEMFTYDGSTYYATRTPGTAGAWKLITGVQNGTSQSLYIDGALASDSVHVIPWPPGDTTRGMSIGIYTARKRWWNGVLDEVRIQHKAVDLAWIRLCYMNQRPDDKLVQFK